MPLDGRKQPKLSESPAVEHGHTQEDHTGRRAGLVGAALLAWAVFVTAAYCLQFKPIVVKAIELIGGRR